MDGIKEGGERASLPQASRSKEEGGSSTINKRGNPRIADTSPDPRDKIISKSKFLHHLEEEGMADPVEGISKINFDHHSLITVLQTGVYSLLD